MIGGDSDLYRFDETAATELGYRLRAFAIEENRKLLICHGRRVQPSAAKTLDQSLGSYLSNSHRFSDPGENPYSRWLALGELFVVSTDSASMIGDAIRTRCPVFLYTPPLKPNLAFAARLHIDEFLERFLGQKRWDKLTALGFYVPVKRMDLLVQQVIRTYGAMQLGESERCMSNYAPSKTHVALLSQLKSWVR